MASLLGRLHQGAPCCLGVMWDQLPSVRARPGAGRSDQQRARCRGPAHGRCSARPASTASSPPPQPSSRTIPDLRPPPAETTTDFYFLPARLARSRRCLDPQVVATHPGRFGLDPIAQCAGAVPDGARWLWLRSSSTSSCSNCQTPTHRAGGALALALCAGRQGIAGGQRLREGGVQRRCGHGGNDRCRCQRTAVRYPSGSRGLTAAR